MAAKRTTHRSSKGTKLYAVRKKDGTFEDIQTYKRAHAADLRRSAKDETSAKSIAARAASKPAGGAVAAVGGLFAKAKRAVTSVIGKATAAKKPAAAKPAAKKAAAQKAAGKAPAAAGQSAKKSAAKPAAKKPAGSKPG